jgi:hypothetical protein
MDAGNQTSLVRAWHDYSGTEVRDAVARGLTVRDEALSVDLADGRTITVPLVWFPRLAHGTAAERVDWRFIGGGVGIIGRTWMRTLAW